VKYPTVREVREYFWYNPEATLYVPTRTRKEFIADEEWSTTPRTITKNGRVMNVVFKNAGGGIWEMSLDEIVK